MCWVLPNILYNFTESKLWHCLRTSLSREPIISGVPFTVRFAGLLSAKPSFIDIKGTLMQIWKSPNMCVSYEKNALKISHSYSQVFSSSWSFVNFLKSGLIFNILLSLNVCKQTFHISHMRISQKMRPWMEILNSMWKFKCFLVYFRS